MWPSARAIQISYVFCCLMATIAAVLLLGEDTNWDRQNYHFYTGYALVAGRFGTDVAVADLQTYFNPYVSAATYLAASYLPFPFGALAIASIQFLSVPILYSICLHVIGGRERTDKHVLAMLGTTLGLASPSWLSEIGTTFFSSTTAPLILMGVLLLMRSLREQATPTALASLYPLIAGALLGLAVVLKLTNAFAAAAASFSYLMVLLLPPGAPRKSLRPILAFTLGCVVGVLPGLPWHYWLYSEFGNPVFPLYNSIFRSEFFDPVSFRDERWRFTSVGDFLAFLVQAAAGTRKTSEVPFTDARWLLLVGAIALFATRSILKPKCARQGEGEGGSSCKERVFLLCTVGIGTALWAAMTAYQRYLIPVELLFGPATLVLVLGALPNLPAASVIIAGLLGIAVGRMNVPDWGHDRGARMAHRAPLGVEVPHALRDVPARYLIFGLPNSYLVPFLHEQSLVARLDLGPGFRPSRFSEKVGERFSTKEHWPIRLIGDGRAVASKGREVLTELGILRRGASPLLDCQHWRSRVGQYVSCEVRDGEPEEFWRQREAERGDLRQGTPLPSWITAVSGLSESEPWGRWSDGSLVTFYLAACLPAGPVTIGLKGQSFGPNEGADFVLVAGRFRGAFRLPSAQNDYRASVLAPGVGECVDRISVIIPKPTSPASLGMSADGRMLGLGLSSIEIRLSQ